MSIHHPVFIRPIHLFFSFLLLLAVALSGHASTYTWDGKGKNANWSTANNWNPNGAPSASHGDDLIFDTNNRLNTSADNGSWTIHSLTFSSGAGEFSLSGGDLHIGSGGVTNNSPHTETIANQIALDASQTWNASHGDLVFTGSYLDGNGKTLTISGSSAMSATGQLGNLSALTTTGSGSRTFCILTNPRTANMQDTGPATFAGQVNANTLNLGSGTSTFSNSGGSNAQIGGGGINISGTANATFNDAVSSTGGINITGSGAINFAGSISGAALTLSGSGTTTLSGTGGKNITSAVVNSGTLIMAQTGGDAINSALTVNSGGTVLFLGNDQIPAWQTVTLDEGSTLLLGNTSQTFTNLIVTGDSIIDFGNDGSILNVTNISVSNHAILTLVNWNNAADLFTSQNNPGANVARIYYADTGKTGIYTAWSHTITPGTPVPEPATYGFLMVAAGIGLVVWRRHHKAKAAIVELCGARLGCDPHVIGQSFYRGHYTGSSRKTATNFKGKLLQRPIVFKLGFNPNLIPVIPSYFDFIAAAKKVLVQQGPMTIQQKHLVFVNGQSAYLKAQPLLRFDVAVGKTTRIQNLQIKAFIAGRIEALDPVALHHCLIHPVVFNKVVRAEALRQERIKLRHVQPGLFNVCPGHRRPV